jgi:hypothetical protein
VKQRVLIIVQNLLQVTVRFGNGSSGVESLVATTRATIAVGESVLSGHAERV